MGTGTLYLLATPIGHLEDITLRALKVLKSVNLILCEDTRTTKKLLDRYNIKKKQRSYYSPREYEQAERYLNLLEKGKDIALVSESGTPCVSDPGLEIVDRALSKNMDVKPVPGPSALTAAVSVSGIKADELLFTGFISRQKGKRKRYLEKHMSKSYAMLIYESKHRIKDTLKFIKEIDPDRTVFIGREMTKKFEEYLRGPALKIYDNINNRENLRGEFVILCSGAKM
ncbi:MAG: 16S rRNA (cytidine(1402)-2'-O)-methyltransferase [Elusimicrobiota bacterium]